MEKPPYTESRIDRRTVIRTFSADTSSEELKWHFDDEHRVVEPMNENDWQFQFDNHLPIPIREKINIPRGVIHRVIAGSTDLVVKITRI